MTDSIDNIYYPILVPDRDETMAEYDRMVQERWEKFRGLPESVQSKLSDDSVAEKIRSVSEEFGLSRAQTIAVSRSVRQYYFGKISLLMIASELAKEPGISDDKAIRLQNEIVQKIIQNSESARNPVSLSRMSLKEALKKYPEIGEQAITSNFLELKSFPYPVRPSVKNWISDYVFNVGINNKDSLANNRYLFRSPNTEKLSESDRARISEIFKSLDEGTPLAIDERKKAIVFGQSNVPAGSKKPEASVPTPAATPRQPLPERTAKPFDSKTPEANGILDRRLGAWRKGLPEKSDAPANAPLEKEAVKQPAGHPYDSRMTFSSPQRLPVEKTVPTLPSQSAFQKPAVSVSPKNVNEPVDLSHIRPMQGKPATARNVVDLREE